jgi:RND family efflux transporter MFP subunit
MKSKPPIWIWLLVTAVVAAAFWAGRTTGTPPVPPKPSADTLVSAPPLQTVQATRQLITEWYEAVGTIRPRVESVISAQITAQILQVKANPGMRIQKDQILMTLDSRQYTSRLDAARQAAVAARAELTRAQSDYDRTRKYFASEAATAQEMERAQEALTRARAGLRQVEEQVREAETALGYTTIRAAQNGEILQRLVEPGDLALPGKALLIVQTEGALRLEARVREGLIGKATPGRTLPVVVEALNLRTKALVEEIVPYADPRSRTFLVKAALPETAELFPGMYGKMLIPVSENQVVMIPRKAVRRVGQLELTTVQEGDRWQRRMIQTGRTLGDQVEVLSGLDGHETIGLNE